MDLDILITLTHFPFLKKRVLVVFSLIIVERKKRWSGNTSHITHFAQSRCTFMGGWYLKAYKTTKMASGKDDFFCKNDFDAALAEIDAEFNHLEKIIRSNASFVRKFVYPKQVYKGKRKQNINNTLLLIVSVKVILVVSNQDWNSLISV